jgi:hypothetical protein
VPDDGHQINETKEDTMNATQTAEETKCADRIAEKMARREETIRQMVEQAEGSDYYGDEEAIYELALSINTKKVTTICLSWGGPSDYIEITHDEDGISKMMYRFSDWFDTATLYIEEGSHLWNYGAMILEGMGE